MKPYIYKFRGVWRCVTMGDGQIRGGLGYTPVEAWVDWCSTNAVVL